ncbi:MAG: hypothetical protein R2857_10630 [Vampirovibrionales bacterium]
MNFMTPQWTYMTPAYGFNPGRSFYDSLSSSYANQARPNDFYSGVASNYVLQGLYNYDAGVNNPDPLFHMNFHYGASGQQQGAAAGMQRGYGYTPNAGMGSPFGNGNAYATPYAQQNIYERYAPVFEINDMRR